MDMYIPRSVKDEKEEPHDEYDLQKKVLIHSCTYFRFINGICSDKEGVPEIKIHYQLIVSENKMKTYVRINASCCIPIFTITNKNINNKT